MLDKATVQAIAKIMEGQRGPAAELLARTAGHLEEMSDEVVQFFVWVFLLELDRRGLEDDWAPDWETLMDDVDETMDGANDEAVEGKADDEPGDEWKQGKVTA